MSRNSRPVYSRAETLGFRLQLAIAFLTTSAITGSRPTTTYRALDLGAGNFEVGLVQSAFSILPALTAVAVGRFIDRNGESRMYTAALLVLAAGAILAALAGDLVTLAIAQSLFGFGAIAALIAGQAMIVTRAAPDDWNRRYGQYAAGLSLGQLVGPTIAASIMSNPSLGPDPERVVYLAAAGSALIATGLTRLIPPGTRPPPVAKDAGSGFLPTIRRVMGRSGMPAAMFVSVTVASTIDILAAYLPIYGVAQNLSVQLVGLLLSIRAAATMASRLAMDQLLRRFGWQRVLVACLAISCVTLALIPTTATPAFLVVIALGLGLAIGMTQPMTITWVANRAPRAERGTALAVRLTGNRTSLLFFPALMGAVAGSAGVAAVFWVVAAMLGMGSMVAHRAQLSRSDETGESSGAASAAAEPGAGETGAGGDGSGTATTDERPREPSPDRGEAPPPRPAGT